MDTLTILRLLTSAFGSSSLHGHVMYYQNSSPKNSGNLSDSHEKPIYASSGKGDRFNMERRKWCANQVVSMSSGSHSELVKHELRPVILDIVRSRSRNGTASARKFFLSY